MQHALESISPIQWMGDHPKQILTPYALEC